MSDTVKSLDDNFRDWESHVFGYGYGTGEPYTTGAVLGFFQSLDSDDDGNVRNYDYRTLETNLGGAVAWLIINALCHADIIEYGTSPRFGWLTGKGECLRDYINGKSLEDLLANLRGTEDYVECYPDACNCGDQWDPKRVCPNPFWRDPK